MSYGKQIAEELAEQLKDRGLAAFIGAGVSRTYTDPGTNRQFNGIPSAGEIVADLQKSVIYLKSEKDLTFDRAFFLVRNHESRQGLEQRVLSYADRKNVRPLPAHDLLATLPFSAYLTTNFDVLLERAFETVSKDYSVLMEDYDITHLKGSQVPLIKLHGCITRPKTIIAAEDEYITTDKKTPIIAALVQTLLAYKRVLFLGFSLRDPDFTRTYEELIQILGNHMPRSYAVVRDATSYDKTYWASKGLTIIEEDLTLFLRDLKVFYNDQYIASDENDWANNSFFSSLSLFTSAPSETQAIDAFLEHLRVIASGATQSCAEILTDADFAVRQILSKKENFEALKELWRILKPRLASNNADMNGFQHTINLVIEERLDYARKINNKWNEVVRITEDTEEYNILVFSQSVRLLDLLKAVPSFTQRKCNLYICECRPKSPDAFQDAFAIYKYLEETDYNQFFLIPDMAAGNLIERGIINVVVMGAHSIYLKDGQPISFVNTCGTSMIALMAREYGIPVRLIAEKAKFVSLPSDNSPKVSYEEEANIFLNTQSFDRLTRKNIGYDLCKIDKRTLDRNLFTVITN